MGLRHTVFTCTEGLSVNRMRTDRCAIWGTNDLYGTMVGGKIFVHIGYSSQHCVCVRRGDTGRGLTLGIVSSLHIRTIQISLKSLSFSLNSDMQWWHKIKEVTCYNTGNI